MGDNVKYAVNVAWRTLLNDPSTSYKAFYGSIMLDKSVYLRVLSATGPAINYRPLDAPLNAPVVKQEKQDREQKQPVVDLTQIEPSKSKLVKERSNEKPLGKKESISNKAYSFSPIRRKRVKCFVDAVRDIPVLKAKIDRDVVKARDFFDFIPPKWSDDDHIFMDAILQQTRSSFRLGYMEAFICQERLVAKWMALDNGPKNRM